MRHGAGLMHGRERGDRRRRDAPQLLDVDVDHVAWAGPLVANDRFAQILRPTRREPGAVKRLFDCLRSLSPRMQGLAALGCGDPELSGNVTHHQPELSMWRNGNDTAATVLSAKRKHGRERLRLPSPGKRWAHCLR